MAKNQYSDIPIFYHRYLPIPITDPIFYIWNPTVQESLKSAVAIRAQLSLNLDHVQGNCSRKRRLIESKEFEEEIDATPLPKRKRHSKKKE